MHFTSDPVSAPRYPTRRRRVGALPPGRPPGTLTSSLPEEDAVAPLPRLTRRALIAGAGAGLLSACASPGPTPAGPSSAPHSPSPSCATPSATEEPPVCGAPAPTPSATGATASGLELPPRDAIVARFADRTPTQWGLDVTGVVTRTPGPAVALTLDGCGGPNGSGVDTALLDFLIAEQFAATLFLNQRWITANRPTFDRLATRPDLFTIANHGTRHAPLSVTGRSAYGIAGTKDAGEVYDEVAGNHAFLTELLGRPPRFFRAGTAWYDEVAVEIVRALGELPIGFDVNADGGATYPAATVAAETAKATPGSIVIGHLNAPQGATFEGLRTALPALRERGLTFATLDALGVA
nr:polysaccharide deacetylase family protein [Propionibacterium sp.]